MKLSESSIREFMVIYREEFGEELSYEQAEQMGSELLSLYNLIISKN